MRLRRFLYENGLTLFLGAIFLGAPGRPTSGRRRSRNWQSEFLAVGSMGILSVYLRQRGSPESKPVGAPHDATGVSG